MSEKKPKPKLCGAKTRTGRPCRNYAMPNGRCRLHGGKSTGPKDKSKLKGNKHRLTTGEYEAIWEDTLTEEEKALFYEIELDKLKAVENEIKLVEIRERRMMNRIKKLKQVDMVALEEEKGVVMGKEVNVTKSVNNLQLINDIEEALTRVQNTKHRLIQEKHRIEEDLGKGTEVEDLSAVIEEIYGGIDGLTS